MSEIQVIEMVERRLLLNVGCLIRPRRPEYDRSNGLWHIQLECPVGRENKGGRFGITVGTAAVNSELEFVSFPEQNELLRNLAIAQKTHEVTYNKKRKASILLAEDVPYIVRQWRSAFEETDPYGKITYVFDGREAVNVASQERYDVAIIDVNMPKMSGVAALKEIYRVHADIKAFFLTGEHSRSRVAELAEREGLAPMHRPGFPCSYPCYIVAIKGQQALTADELEQMIDLVLTEQYDRLPKEMFVR